MDVWIPTHIIEAFSCTDHATLHAQVLLFTLYSFMWGVCVLHAQWCCTLAVSLTCPVRLYVWSLSYTPCAICWWYFLWQLHTLLWGVSLTRSMLFRVGIFSYTPHAVLCGEFLLHAPSCFMWGVSLPRHCCFMWGVSLTRPCCFMCGFSLTHPVLIYVGSFRYTPLALLYREFLLHSICRFIWAVSLRHPLLFYVESFSYTSPAVL